MVVASALATCNTYTILRILEIAKKVNPEVKTVVGGQNFTALADESLKMYPEIDFIIRGEGEETLNDLVRNLDQQLPLSGVKGLSFRHGTEIIHNPPHNVCSCFGGNYW